MPWNDNANPGPWGSPPGDGDRRDGPGRRGPGGGPRGPNFDPGFDRLGRQLGDMFRGPDGRPRRGLFLAIAAGAVGIWIFSGVYRVEPNEKGVVLTFGRYSGISDPGLNYHLPAPIAHVEKVPVTTLKKTDVGGGAQGGEGLAESMMLTGDEQIIDIDFSVIWRVADARKYLFATRDPEQAVKAVAESAMREVVGRTLLQPILSTGRGAVQQQTAEVMQRTLDSWGTGVSIVEVQIRSAQPPADVNDAFRDVQSAQQDADSRVNEANTYRNRVINEARGDAAKIVQSAEAYREAAVREAQGEAARFNQLVTEYKRAPGVTRDRLYIETMQRVLQNSNKVIIDAKGATAPIILPPDAFRLKGQAAATPAPAPSRSQGEAPQPQAREARQ